jgi:hypothetical protein
MSLDFTTRCQSCGKYGPADEAACVKCGAARPDELRSFRDLLEEAASDVETYREPDISDVTDMIDEVLKAIGGVGWIGTDEVTSLHFSGSGDLTVTTSYSVRSCAQTDRFSIPSHVIDADDPIVAGKQFGKEGRITVAKRKMKSLREELKSAEKDLAAALAE